MIIIGSNEYMTNETTVKLHKESKNSTSLYIAHDTRLQIKLYKGGYAYIGLLNSDGKYNIIISSTKLNKNNFLLYKKMKLMTVGKKDRGIRLTIPSTFKEVIGEDIYNEWIIRVIDFEGTKVIQLSQKSMK